MLRTSIEPAVYPAVGKRGGAKKHEIYAAAFGNHLLF